MTENAHRLSLLVRSPAQRPEIAAAIMSAVTGGHPPVFRPAVFRISKIEILRLVARETGISVPELQGPSRFAHMVRARQIYCALARRFTKRSLPDIGAMIRRDHSTVMHAIQQVKDRPDDFEPHLWNLTAQLERIRSQQQGQQS